MAADVDTKAFSREIAYFLHMVYYFCVSPLLCQLLSLCLGSFEQNRDSEDCFLLDLS